MKTISSQRFIDDEIVAAKRCARDYTVTVSPIFKIDGEDHRAVIDGHHSFEAAKIDGVKPNFVEASVQTDDRIFLLQNGAIDDYLELCWMDDDWYDINTGRGIF